MIRFTAAPKDKEKILDPLRLPDQLRHWAARMKDAGIPTGDWAVKIQVKRQKQPLPAGGNNQFDSKVLELVWDKNWDFGRIEPFSKDSPQAIPELGLGYQVKTMIVAVEPPANAGDNALHPGDAITAVKFHSIIDNKGTIREGDWQVVGQNQWSRHFFLDSASPLRCYKFR